MRKNYWVSIQFRDNHDTFLTIKKAFFTTPERLNTEVNVFLERLMEQNPMFKYMYTTSTVTEVKES